MADHVVYTAIFGEYDELHAPLVRSPGCDYVCFTDRPFSSEGWEVRVVACDETDARRAARRCKVLSHVFCPDHSVSLWVDGNVRPAADVRSLMAAFLRETDLCVFPHYCRRCIYAEARECRRLGLDDAATIDAQMDDYRRQGYPENRGLAETGALLRRHSHRIRRFNEVWWEQVSRFSVRDQLSFDYVAWELGVTYATFPGEIRSSRHFEYLPHLGTEAATDR